MFHFGRQVEFYVGEIVQIPAHGWIGVIAGWDLTKYDPDNYIDKLVMSPYYFVLLDQPSMNANNFKSAYLSQVMFQILVFILKLKPKCLHGKCRKNQGI